MNMTYDASKLPRDPEGMSGTEYLEQHGPAVEDMGQLSEQERGALVAWVEDQAAMEEGNRYRLLMKLAGALDALKGVAR